MTFTTLISIKLSLSHWNFWYLFNTGYYFTKICVLYWLFVWLYWNVSEKLLILFTMKTLIFKYFAKLSLILSEFLVVFSLLTFSIFKRLCFINSASCNSGFQDTNIKFLGAYLFINCFCYWTKLCLSCMKVAMRSFSILIIFRSLSHEFFFFHLYLPKPIFLF